MNQYVEFIINEILNNISNKAYNVSETVSRIPLTEDYIRKLFLRETGKTPLQYLAYKRIDTAKQLLRTGSRWVADQENCCTGGGL